MPIVQLQDALLCFMLLASFSYSSTFWPDRHHSLSNQPQKGSLEKLALENTPSTHHREPMVLHLQQALLLASAELIPAWPGFGCAAPWA